MTVLSIDQLPDEIGTLRARRRDRDLGLFSSGHLFTRRTSEEADEYYHYIVRENGDWEGADQIVAMRIRGKGESIPAKLVHEMKERHMAGVGSFPLVGSYDDVAHTLKRLSDAGLDGMAIGLVNYIDELPVVRDELLPRLERLGLRKPVRAT